MPRQFISIYQVNIIGAGGHAKVILSTIEQLNITHVHIFDDSILNKNIKFSNRSLSGPITADISGETIIAIGSNSVRKHFSEFLDKATWIICIHPTAVVESSVYVGEGTVIMAGAIIQPGAKIGRHCIINTGACIDHDCVIDDYVHIAPGVTLAGGVKVGEGSLIGVGTSIVPNVTVGKWATIGAGSAVISDIPDYSTAVGVPAIIKKINNESI